MCLTVLELSNADKHGEVKRSVFATPKNDHTKTVAWWWTDMTSILCIHLASHFVRMPSCFITFMLPFRAAALAWWRYTFISAMGDHRSVLESYRSAVWCIEPITWPPITYSTSPTTATQWPNLGKKIAFCVMFYISLVLTFICCWHRSIFLYKRQLYCHHRWIGIQIRYQANLEKLWMKAVIGICCLNKD
jgi:hypothetical protein